jgi:hypothetical protein
LTSSAAILAVAHGLVNDEKRGKTAAKENDFFQ